MFRTRPICLVLYETNMHHYILRGLGLDHQRICCNTTVLTMHNNVVTKKRQLR